MRFHLGEPIHVQWEAPQRHSRRDWIGIYRVGANKSTLITKVSSFGLWVPVHDEEWDGDVPVGNARVTPRSTEAQTGTVAFQGSTLPWTVGRYEVRYHHDGKHNVLGIDGPLEVYVNKPTSLDFTSVRECLTDIIPLCLDNDPRLIPMSCGGTCDASVDVDKDHASDDARDPDDFSFWSERQAKRICTAVKQAFNVEYAPEVIVADANLTRLAHRIMVSKQLLVS